MICRYKKIGSITICTKSAVDIVCIFLIYVCEILRICSGMSASEELSIEHFSQITK
jgi:hypothetical protein